MKNNARFSIGSLNKIKHMAFFFHCSWALFELEFSLLFRGHITDRERHGDSKREVSSGGDDTGVLKPL